MRNIRDFEAILLREISNKGLINNERRIAILREQALDKIPLLEIIQRDAVVSNDFVLQFLSENLQARIIREGEQCIPTFTSITDELFKKFRIIISFTDETHAKVFFHFPIFHATWEEIEEEINHSVEKVIIDYARYNEICTTIEKGINMRKEFSLSPQKELDKIAENTRAIRFAEEVLEKCVHLNASDIHIEPQKQNFRIRMRLNGVLQVFGEYDSHFYSSFSSRIKLISNLNIAEKRDTQDGAIVYKYNRQGQKSLDIPFRVSVIPVIYGEKIVLRRLGGQEANIKLSHLGMNGSLLENWKKVISKPHGIILVSGPTGSGKSTTLQAAINEIKSDEINIVTVEDPVEAKIAGINQVQIDAYKVSFADALRAILRQDPDVIMIGEIRDKETAEIALRASLTGHLVYSTIHTNDAPSSVTRLIDMGIEPFLVSSSVAAVLAQRLIRVLCPACKEEYDATEMDLALLQLKEPKRIFRKCGCYKCNNTGYTSRIGVYELLIIDSNIQKMINECQSDIQIKEYAINKLAMPTIYMETKAKVLAGITSIDELKKIVAH